ncbi:MAG TPA: GAF domain-containing protein, partial [Acidimicrobiales bacterium]|nr:GAF domain-containing protein [Acidimicrobiales bacterium]
MQPGGTTTTRRMELPPELASAGRARRLVHAAVAEWGLPHLADDVALGVSELVANAVLHAHTDIELVVERKGGGVRASVRDTSAHDVSLPWQRADEGPDDEWRGSPLDAEAMTGRGLTVVASVADAWGVEVDGGGKTVWMEAGTGAGPAPAPAGGDDARAPAPPAAGLDARPVRLLGVPVRLALAGDANLDDLVREFQVLTMADREAPHPVPGALIRLFEEVLHRTEQPRLSARQAARAAAGAGHRLVDVTLAVPVEVVPDLWHLALVLEQVAAYCRQGAMLSLAPSEELAAFRRWWVSEVERQVHGSPPRPCPFPVAPPDQWAPAGPERPDEALAAERAARTVAEEAAARLAGLQEVTAGLSAAVTSEQVADVVLGQGLALLGAATGSFCLLQPDGATVEIVRAVGYDPSVTEHWRRFGVSDDVPASEAIRTGRAVYLHSLEERDLRYPIFKATPTVGSAASAVVPLVVETGTVLGALAVGYARPQSFPAADRAFLRALAAQAAQALERARLHEAERRAHARFAFLSEASAVLSASLDLHETLRALADLVVPRLSDWCTVHVLQGGRPVFVVAAHRDPAKRRLAEEVNRRWPVELGQGGIGGCLETGEPVRFQVVPAEMLDHAARDEEHRRVLRDIGLGSGMVVPLKAGGRVLGAMALANERGRVVSEDTYRLALDLGARAGAAVANAQLFAERSHVARALQASLLPPTLPRAEGIDFGARYVAAGQGLDVGGDFFDVFPTDSRWLVAVGDVRGKGVEAAAVTGLARHT